MISHSTRISLRNRVRRLRATPGVVALVLPLAACGGGSVGDDVAEALREFSGGPRPADLEALAPRLLVGAAEGQGSDVLGTVAGALPLEGGGLVVLDGGGQRLVLFDAAGAVLDRTPGEGQGPREFRFGRFLRGEVDGTLTVLDGGNRRLARFRAEGDSLRLLGQEPLETITTDYCRLDGDLYLLRGRQDRLVEVVPADGTPGIRFGTMPPMEHMPEAFREGARETVAAGRIACLPEAGLVVVLGRFLPEVTAWSPAGDLRWRTTLRRYVPLSVVAAERGGRTVSTFATVDGSWLHHMAATLQPMGDVLAVQLAVLDFSHREPGAREVDTRFLSLETGEEVGRTLELPLLGEVRGEEAAVYLNAPFPRAAVVDLGAVLTVRASGEGPSRGLRSPADSGSRGSGID